MYKFNQFSMTGTKTVAVPLQYFGVNMLVSIRMLLVICLVGGYNTFWADEVVVIDVTVDVVDFAAVVCFSNMAP